MITYRLLIVLIQILLVFGQESAALLNGPKEEAHEKSVIEFYLSTHSNVSNADTKKYTLQKFEDNLVLIFEQLYKYNASVFPIGDEVKNSNSITIRLNYVENVCLHIFRCMDYLYISSIPKNTILFKMYKSHSNFCSSIQKFFIYKTRITMINNEEINVNCGYYSLWYFYENVISFKRPTNEENSIMYKTDRKYQDIAKDFILYEYELMNDINWTSKFNIESAKYNILNRVSPIIISLNNTLKLQKFSDLHKIGDHKNEYQNLHKTLDKYNNEYLSELNSKHCTPAPGYTLEDLNRTKPDVMTSNLLLYTFQTLEKHFINFVRQSNTTKGKVNIEHIKTNIFSEFNRLCEHVPEILLYLYEYNKNDSTNANLFSLYLSCCGIDMDFIYFRCPGKGEDNESKILYNEKCVIKSIIDKLLWNSYVRTNDISHVEYLANQANNTNCSVLNYNYIKNISTTLVDFYKKVYNEVIVWTTHNWISGKHLLTASHSESNIDYLKYVKIDIENTDFTLLEVYYYFLPLNSNIDTVFTFHNLVLNHLHEIMNVYIYRHAIMILIFFKKPIENKKKQKIIRKLKNSLEWYENGRFLNYQYLPNLPVKYQPPQQILNIVKYIKNLNEKDDSKTTTSNIYNQIPKLIHDEITDDIVQLLNTKAESTYYNNLGKLLNENCVKAVYFIYILFSIIQKSTKTINLNPDHFNYKNEAPLCQGLTDIFLPVGWLNNRKSSTSVSLNSSIVDPYFTVNVLQP